MISDLLEEGACVIATGGGALTTAETLQALKERAIIVWLNPDCDTLWERVSKSDNRPLLHTENPKQRMEDLLEARQGLYAQAHICYEGEQNPTEDIINLLYEFLNADTV